AESDDGREREGNSQGVEVQPKVEPLEMVLNSRAAADLVEQKTVMRQVLELYFAYIRLGVATTA
nr:poly(A) polymerase [Tanacetum cinerariifolium]